MLPGVAEHQIRTPPLPELQILMLPTIPLGPQLGGLPMVLVLRGKVVGRKLQPFGILVRHRWSLQVQVREATLGVLLR